MDNHRFNLRGKGKAVTQILHSGLLTGEQKLAKLLFKYLNLKKDGNQCNAQNCSQEWKLEQIKNNEAILYKDKIWCPECLWKRFSNFVPNYKIGWIENFPFGDSWLAIRDVKSFTPKFPIKSLYRFPLKKQKQGWDKILNRVKQGFDLVRQVQSNCLFQVESYKKIDNFGYILTEYVPGITLEKLLKFVYNKKGFTQFESIALLRKLAQAIHILHKNNIIHGNITPKSIHISLNGGVKLGNFFIAHSKNEGYEDIDIVKTMIKRMKNISYIKHETNLKTIGQDSDLWAWGVIAFEILEGKNPFLNNLTAKNIEDLGFSRKTPGRLQKIVYSVLESKYNNANSIKNDLDLIQN